MRILLFSGKGGSEEHTSELQSPCNLVCRLLLEKKRSSAVMVRQSFQASSGAVSVFHVVERARRTSKSTHGSSHAAMSLRGSTMLFFFLMMRRTPRSTLFPYTTLFR